MKRLLSILLSVLLVMGTMTTVAFADGITLSTVMTFAEGDIVVAGGKVLFNVDASAGAELTYYNNGVAVVAEVVSADGSVVALPVSNGVNSYTVSDGTNTSDPVVLNGKGVGTVLNKVAEQDVISRKNAGKATLVEGTKGGVSGTWQVDTSGRWGMGSPAEGQTFEFVGDVYFDGSVKSVNPVALHSGGWLNNHFLLTASGTSIANSHANSQKQHYNSIPTTPNEWHTVRMIVTDVDTGKHDIYVDDILVLKDELPSTWSKTSTQVYFSVDTGTTIYRRNFEANFITWAETEFLVPSGDVWGDKVGVNIRGLASGEKAVAYVNGVATEIASEDGLASITLPEGYSSVYVTYVTAAGKVGYQSEEVVYYRLTPVGEKTTKTSATWEEAKYTEEDATASWPVGSRKFIGMNSAWDDGEVALGLNEVTENGNTYLTSLSWGKETSSGFENTTSTATRLNFTSQERDVTGMVEMSVDYRYDNHYFIDSEGNISKTSSFGTPAEFRGIVPPTNPSASNGMSSLGVLNFYMTYYEGEEYIRESVIPFTFDVTTGYLRASTDFVKKSGGVTSTQRIMELDMGEWHNYKVVVDTVNNRMYLYVDDMLVAAGSAYTDQTKSPARQVECIFWPQVVGAQPYSSESIRMSVSVDDFFLETYVEGVESKTTEAFVNESANGLGLVLDNMTAAEKVADMAVVAIAADGSVNINKFDAAASEQEYKFISFKKPASEIFVWAWENLAPLTEVFEIK